MNQLLQALALAIIPVLLLGVVYATVPPLVLILLVVFIWMEFVATRMFIRCAKSREGAVFMAAILGAIFAGGLTLSFALLPLILVWWGWAVFFF